MISEKIEAEIETAQGARPKSWPQRWGLFVLFGMALFLAVYAYSEYLVYETGERNRFYMVATTPEQTFDHVILGASRAMPFGFDAMNDHLEEVSQTRIMNLSMEGAGVLHNRFVLDYFLTRHDARNIVYFLDDFVFYSDQWNEKRLDDPSLFQKAPLDATLARQMIRTSETRPHAAGYLSGFYKINNEDRFDRDISDAERDRFDSVYRSIPQIDRQRIEFLYPESPEPETVSAYVSAFETLIEDMQERGMTFTIVLPPLPERVHDLVPEHVREDFERTLDRFAEDYGVEILDFSTVANDEEYFYDTDHLNRQGVLNFVDAHFADVLRRESPQ